VHHLGIKGKDLYLLNVLRRRVEYPELKRAVREQCQAFDANVVLIEDKASGTQLVQDLVQDGLHAVTRYQPQSDKFMRMHAQTATICPPPRRSAMARRIHPRDDGFSARSTRRPGRFDGPDARLVQARQRPGSNAGIRHLYKSGMKPSRPARSPRVPNRYR
jgi:hypothetical protein